ncbi:hypothetical protein ACHAWX_003335 [Stephanocyclus meneghinianus]
MGFFKRKTNAPLSTAMYQGDNAVDLARSPPRLGGGSVPLNPDRVQAANTRNKKNKKIPKGFFKRKNNDKSYVTVTPDNKEDGSSIEAGYPPQTRSQRETNTVSTTTPSKSLPAASSSIQVTPPSSRSQDNKNNYQDDNEDETDDNIPALVSPGKYEDLPPSPHEEIKRNLNSVFYQNDNDDEGGVDTCRRGVPANAMTTGDNNNDISNDDDDVIAAGENKKFLKRFRSSWKKRPGKIRQKQELIRLIQETNHRIESANVGTDQSPPQVAVPETIDHSDDGSIPSLITEPEDVKNMNMASTDRTTAVESTVHEEPVSALRTPTSSSRAPGPSRHVVAPFDEKFESGPTPRRALTLGERFLSLLQCREDTTSDGYFGRIKCLDLCAQNNGDENELGPRRMDEEDQFVVSFIQELSKRGIKLIYHQAPADSSSDWTQLTVKLFLRPGQCHEREIRPPSLSWATLPVASRKVLTGSYDNLNNESGEDTLWTHLSLWDIYTVMGAEDDGTVADEECALNSPARTKATMSTTQSGFDSRDTYTRETTSYTRETTSYTRDTFDEEERTVPSSGFFSITAGSNGNVYVFEASSGNRRDYIVAGLKKMIGWATSHLIMGRLDVCAELYGEDAAPMSGELPSLVTPSQALSRVTHAFLDEL